jgi:hypothetical protein
MKVLLEMESNELLLKGLGASVDSSSVRTIQSTQT